MIIDKDYLVKYATPEQLDTVKQCEEQGWHVSHLFTVQPGVVLIWLISMGRVSENKRLPYTHAWLSRDGQIHRWPKHRGRSAGPKKEED